MKRKVLAAALLAALIVASFLVLRVVGQGGGRVAEPTPEEAKPQLSRTSLGASGLHAAGERTNDRPWFSSDEMILKKRNKLIEFPDDAALSAERRRAYFGVLSDAYEMYSAEALRRSRNGESAYQVLDGGLLDRGFEQIDEEAITRMKGILDDRQYELFRRDVAPYISLVRLTSGPWMSTWGKTDLEVLEVFMRRHREREIDATADGAP